MTNPLLAPRPDGLPEFAAIRPEHVEPALQQTLAANRRALEELLARTRDGAPSFEAVVLPLEELGDRLHRVWSPVSHLNAVANSPALRDAYNSCLPALSRYHTEIAQNGALYQLFEQVSGTVAADRGDGARALLDQALRDFRLAGVTLPEEPKRRFMEVMEALTELQAKFEQNLLDAMATWSQRETDPARLAGIPAHLLERAAADAGEAGGWLLRLDQPTYVTVMTHAKNRELRALLHRAWATRASDQAPSPAEFDNGAVMEQILALRHEAARLVGFAGFAEYSLATKMATSVAEVREFLGRLVAASREAARREIDELTRFAGHPLEPWDIAYYSEELRRQKFAVSDEELRPYFPLPGVLQGLFDLVQQLYGLRLEPGDGPMLWHPHARYFRVVDAGGRLVGGLLTDFYARSEKRSGAWMDDCVNRKRLDGHTQLPVAHLVCNFAPPGAKAPSLLSHDEVLTLFHEMGHALHHLLTRIDYPSVAGIHGVPWDAVELPSQFMEGFAWEPEILAMISGHHETGAPLPAATVERLRASRVFQGGMHMVRQLEFALFDLRVHAEYDPGAGARIMPLLRETRAAVAVVPGADYDRFPHGFAHIFGGGYAAGYYSYKWAEVLSSDAYAAFEEQGVLNRALAQRFREEILEIGGSRDIGVAFRNFRGRAPDIAALLRHSGITVAAAGESGAGAAGAAAPLHTR
ncbi:MAG: M3 family metallopeptidase [Gammaproteobacteria bacterium]|nr:MAG: M3 family metallopeptidase [Gammaproteobacteria bacterium]